MNKKEEQILKEYLMKKRDSLERITKEMKIFCKEVKKFIKQMEVTNVI